MREKGLDTTNVSPRMPDKCDDVVKAYYSSKIIAQYPESGAAGLFYLVVLQRIPYQCVCGGVAVVVRALSPFEHLASPRFAEYLKHVDLREQKCSTDIS